MAFFIPVKKEKHCCKVDFDYQIRTKQDFCNALHNSPEVLLKPLREEEISLYQFLKNENIIKAIIVYRQIRSQKIKSQKQYLDWIYDPLSWLILLKNIFDLFSCPPPLF